MATGSEAIQKLVGDAIAVAGGWIRLNREEMGEHTQGDLRDVATQVERLGEFYVRHGRLPEDWAELRRSK